MKYIPISTMQVNNYRVWENKCKNGNHEYEKKNSTLLAIEFNHTDTCIEVL